MTFDLDLWPFTSWTYEGSHITSINQVWFQTTIFQMRWILHFQPILQLDLRWPLTLVYDLWLHEHINSAYYAFSYRINKPSLVPDEFQLFNWDHFHIFSLFYNLTSDDHWPWYVTFDLINKRGFPWCIYDPTLNEIHQSMWKVEPNVNLFSQQQQTTDNNNSEQSDPYVFFLAAKAGNTKTEEIFLSCPPRSKSLTMPLAESKKKKKRVMICQYCGMYPHCI